MTSRTRLLYLLAAVWPIFATPAHAVVGGGTVTTQGVARSVVVVTGARGNICSGVLISPQIVLTAGHCATPDSTYRVIDGDPVNGRTVAVQTVALHPRFSLQTMLAHRATADIALLRLATPLATRSSAVTVGIPRQPITANARFTIAGIGVTAPASDSGIGTTRVATLTVTGRPGSLQIRLFDPVTRNKRPGLGACTGDSGAPVFEDQGGEPVIVGVVSLSTGSNNSDGCGGLTIVTPLTLYRDWIVKTARSWGARF